MIDNTNNSIGEKNPYRYRSYYYDTETTWYYLNSRYYNPNIGRFITMDEIEYLGATSSILSYNLFIYCEGNPVNLKDPNGNLAFPGEIHKAVVDHIADKYGFGKNIGMYTWYGIGFCDLMSKSGEIWEVKSHTLSFEKAKKQLNKYINGRIHPSSYEKNPGMKMQNYYIGRDLPPETFTANTRSGTYTVEYESAGEGIIYYKYHKESNKSSYSGATSPATFLSPGEVTAICIGLGLIAGGGYMERNLGYKTNWVF